MSGQIRYSDEFKIDAVAQVTERGYSVKEVAERLGVSTKSLYTWMAQCSKPQRHEPPHLNWSSAMFRKRRNENGEQATKARRDCLEVAAG